MDMTVREFLCQIAESLSPDEYSSFILHDGMLTIRPPDGAKSITIGWDSYGDIGVTFQTEKP